MRITSKVFVIILLFVIINILLYIFLISNKQEIKPSVKQTIPDSKKQDLHTYEFNMYYVEWCGWSRKALPDFTKLKDWIDKNKNKIGDNKIFVHLIDVDKIDSIVDNKTKEKLKKDIKVVGVKSYPTIVLFNGKTKLIDPYEGERTFAAYKKYLNNL